MTFSKTTKLMQVLLNSLDQIKEYFKNNFNPIYYISLTKINLLNIDKWVNNFHYISLDNDLYSQNFKKYNLDHDLFANIILSDNVLINDITANTTKPSFIFLKYNLDTENLLKKHKFQLLNPPFYLYRELDSKIDILYLIEKIGIPTIPYIISEIKNYSDIASFQKKFGNKLVIQSPFGSTGEGTFFIRNKHDVNKYQKHLFDKGPMRIMKEIDCKQYGIDACATRCGTILGPILTDLVGDRNLINVRGGSCGNEIFKDIIDTINKDKILEYTKKIGDYLYSEKKFRGSFTVDYLLDKSTNTIFFGEINPRISSAGFLTNEVMSITGIPIFLFHLLEFFDIDFNINVDEFNLSIQESINNNCFSQVILSNIEDKIDNTINIKSGIWKMINKNSIVFVRSAESINEIRDKSEAFIFVPSNFESLTKDNFTARIGFKNRIMNDQYQLTNKTKTWIKLFKKLLVLNTKN
ncbi:MAG: hypothetical protein H6630_01375 [Arcobacter sp.]|nr:hypothetical protein [Arcobacter sp.]